MEPKLAPRISFDQGTLLLSGTEPQQTSPSGDAFPWVYDHRCKAFRCDAMHYRDVSQRLQREPAGSWTDDVASWGSIHFAKRDLNTLRPDQTAALDAWMVDRRGVVVMPTGTGKTEVALHAIVACSCSVLVVAPVRDLMYQWHERIRRATGVDAGIIGDGVHRVSPVCVTTYDSAAIAILEQQFEHR